MLCVQEFYTSFCVAARFADLLYKYTYIYIILVVSFPLQPYSSNVLLFTISYILLRLIITVGTRFYQSILYALKMSDHFRFIGHHNYILYTVVCWYYYRALSFKLFILFHIYMKPDIILLYLTSECVFCPFG